MLKAVLLVMTLIFSMGISAQDYCCCTPDTGVGGFYIGLGGGASRCWTEWNMKIIDHQINAPDPESSVRHYQSGGQGWDGQLSVGYGHVFCNGLYLGAEAFGSISNLDGTFWHTFVLQPVTQAFGLRAAFFDQTFKLHVPHTFGFALRPGYYITPGSLLYARVGYVRSKFHQTNHNAEIEGFLPFAPLDVNLPRFKKNRSGFQLGLGNEVQLTCHLSFRQEYTWEKYDHHISGTFVSNTNSQGRSRVRENKYTPEIDRLSLALVYHFRAQGNAPDCCNLPRKTGGRFLIGGNVGRYSSNFSGFYKYKYQIEALPQYINSETFSQDSQLRDFTGNLFIGYGYSFCNRFFLGAEIGGGIATGESKLVFHGLSGYWLNWDNKFVQKDRYHISFAIVPGFQITDTEMIYIKAGPVWSVSKISNFTSIRANPQRPPEPDQSRAVTYTRHSYLVGGLIGLGIQTDICRNLSLITEATWTYFGKYKYHIRPYRSTHIGGPAFPQINHDSFWTKRTESASFTIGLVYSFDSLR